MTLPSLAKRVYWRLAQFRQETEFRRIWPAIDKVEGLLVSPVQEMWLFRTASSLPSGANIVEIGSFKGRSTCCLAFGCRDTRKHVYAIDTFNGNDKDFEHRNFFPDFQRNIRACGLVRYVTPLRMCSSEAAATWSRPIHLLFIDGSHDYEDVLTDFNAFFPHVVDGGIVAMHDIIEGWPGPLRVWHEHARATLTGIGYCSTLAYGRKAVSQPRSPVMEAADRRLPSG